MKIKFATFFLSIFMIACLFLSGCAGVNGVEYNIKYYEQNISKEQIESNEVKYIIFKNSNYGIIRDCIFVSVRGDNYSFTTKKYYYNVEFKYTKVDDATIMITYKEQNRIFDDESYENNDTNCISYLFVVSKNVVGLSNASGVNYYFNENYLSNNGFLQ